MKHLYGLILAGGHGTRLWPISREYYPKQFLQLFGNKTLIQQTFDRLTKIIPPEKIYISTNRVFVDEIITQLEKFGFCKENIIIQPVDKNTGPAIAQASKIIFNKNKSAIIVNSPADHIIEPEIAFVASIEAAYELAQKGSLVTLGVKPKSPNSGYGYISLEKSPLTLKNSYISYKVKKFIEKPSLEKSAALIKEGSLWNSGIFIWGAETILHEIKKWSDDIYNAISSQKQYFSSQSISIDNGILEKSDMVSVIPVNFEWKDLGSWDALYELLPKDENRNVLNNSVVVSNCYNSLIYGVEGRTVAAINVNDMIIVDSKDDVLISHREGIHEMKKVLKNVKANNQKKITHKPLVTILIPTYNDFDYIKNTMDSAFNQTYKNIEYIILDQGSTDGTMDILNKYKYKIEHILTLPTSDFFSRVNKGIAEANGEIITILKPDNAYFDIEAVNTVVRTMELEKTDLCWGDLVYFNNKDTNKISMYWKSSQYKKDIFLSGWSPPFPTFFVRSSIYKKYGTFNPKFHIAAEYEILLRFLEKQQLTSSYIPKILVKMVGRGITVKNLYHRVTGNIETYEAWRENGMEISPFFLVFKNITKLSQLWSKKAG